MLQQLIGMYRRLGGITIAWKVQDAVVQLGMKGTESRGLEDETNVNSLNILRLVNTTGKSDCS